MAFVLMISHLSNIVGSDISSLDCGFLFTYGRFEDSNMHTMHIICKSIGLPRAGGGLGGGGRGRGIGGPPGMGMGISGGGPGMLGRAGGGFGPRGGPHSSFLGGSGGPGAMRMEKIHPHRFNPIGMGGGYVQSHFW